MEDEYSKWIVLVTIFSAVVFIILVSICRYCRKTEKKKSSTDDVESAGHETIAYHRLANAEVDDYVDENSPRLPYEHSTLGLAEAQQRHDTDVTKDLYTSCRHDAQQLLEQAEYHSEEATRAQSLRKFQEAKSHNRKAEEYQRRAQVENDQAAEKIFHTNNARQPLGTIDLHGLHTNEIDRFLFKAIKACKNSRKSTLKVITGRGSHSKDGRSHLKPAVKKFCDQNNYVFKVHTGNIVIEL